MGDLDLREERYDGRSARRLIAQVQDEYVVRYGGPDTAPVQPEEFAPPKGRFLVGYLGDEPVAMGGIRRVDADTMEIKRMFVSLDCRGRGLARVVLGRLEQLALEMGATRVVLETGMRQPEAMSLYAGAGYDRIEGFGHYRDEPLSVSFGKSLNSR